MKTKRIYTDVPVELKECIACHWVLPKSEFNNHPTASDGLQSKCRQCSSEYRKKYYHADNAAAVRKTVEWQQQNRGRYNKRSREWRAKNKDKIKATITRFYLNHPSKRREKTLKKYGLTVESYADMLAEQGGKCAICGLPQLEATSPFSVDHCHKSGKVRGILCFVCNTTLGRVHDNTQILFSMINYLEMNQGERNE